MRRNGGPRHIIYCASIAEGGPWQSTFADPADEENTTSQIAFEQAGALAFREACTRAGLALLEPIMKVVVVTPDEHFGSVSGDLADISPAPDGDGTVNVNDLLMVINNWG